jgi:hypothetical protein
MARWNELGSGGNRNAAWFMVVPPSGSANQYGYCWNRQFTASAGVGGLGGDNLGARHLVTNGSLVTSLVWTGRFTAAETGVHRLWWGCLSSIAASSFPGSLDTHNGSPSREYRGNHISVVENDSPTVAVYKASAYQALPDRLSGSGVYDPPNRYTVFAPVGSHPSYQVAHHLAPIRSGNNKRALSTVQLRCHIRVVNGPDNGRTVSPVLTGDMAIVGTYSFVRFADNVVGSWLGTKFYFEATITTASTGFAFGYAYSGNNNEFATAAFPGTGDSHWGYLAGVASTRTWATQGSATGLAAWQAGDVIGCLLDYTNVNDIRVYFTRNGAPYANSSLPSTVIWHQTGAKLFVTDVIDSVPGYAGRFTLNTTGPFVFLPAGALAYDFENAVGESGIPRSATQFLLHLDGTEGSTTITDSSVWKRTWQTANGSLTTAVKKFGTASWRVTGLYGGISMAAPYTSNEAFRLNNGDWCMECWFNHPVGDFGNGSLLSVGYPSITDRFEVMFTGGNNLVVRSYVGGTLMWSLPTTFTENVWQHVAVVRHNGDVKLYIDGNLRGTRVAAELLTTTEPYFNISGNLGGAYEYVEGYVDEARFTKGYPRYTADFTPPVAAFPDP